MREEESADFILSNDLDVLDVVGLQEHNRGVLTAFHWQLYTR